MLIKLIVLFGVIQIFGSIFEMFNKGLGVLNMYSLSVLLMIVSIVLYFIAERINMIAQNMHAQMTIVASCLDKNSETFKKIDDEFTDIMVDVFNRFKQIAFHMYCSYTASVVFFWVSVYAY
jgi:hypothetical protein